MSKKSQLVDSERRNFLKGSVTAAAGAALTSMAGASQAGIAETEPVGESGRNEGYRLTRHIAEYYKRAAF